MLHPFDGAICFPPERRKWFDKIGILGKNHKVLETFSGPSFMRLSEGQDYTYDKE
jgi:hypothetical protein